MARGSRPRRAAPTPPAPPPGRPGVRVWLALAAVTLLAYYPAWFGGPIWDDDHHLTAPALQGLDGLWRIWFDVGATQQYYPLVHSAFWVQHQLWGGHVLGYHLVNIVLHGICAGLVWLILRRLGVPGATFAAGIFALHPVHVESVAWITELKNTLSGALVLWATLRYLDYDEQRDPRAHASALMLFVLALLSKSVTAVMPAAMLVVFWWKRGRIDWRRDVGPLAPFFALGIAAGLFTAWVERTHIGAEGEEFAFTVVERFLIAGRVVWFYLGKLLYPANLMFTYPRWSVSQAVWWQYLYPAAAVAALAAAWAIRHRTRAPLAVALLFGGILFPVLGFFNVYPFRFSFVADHFAYLASIPIIAFFTAGASTLARRSQLPGPAIRGIAVLVTVVLALATFQQSRQYADAETLYRQTLRRNPASWMAHNNLGLLMLEGEPEGALRHFDEAVRLHPGVAESRLNRGNALQRLGRAKEAIDEYVEALRLDSGMATAHNNLASALLAVGEPARALEHARAALSGRPQYVEAHYNAGRASRELGRYGDAVDHLNTAIEQDAAVAPAVLPELALTHNELGVALARDGRLEQAILSLREAVRTRPDYADAHFNLANLLQGAGRVEESLPHYQAAIATNPDDAASHNNLGAALEALGRREEAAAHYREAVRLEPATARFRENLRRVGG